MTTAEIYDIILYATGINVPAAGVKDDEVWARDISVCMMHEEGLTPRQISTLTGIDRPHVYTILHRVQYRLANNLPFKLTYLACIARMAELEDAA